MPLMRLIAVILVVSIPTVVAQDQLACDRSHYRVQVDDVDDVARVYLNEQQLFEVVWGKSGTQPGTIRRIGHRPGDSGSWQDLTPSLRPGPNVVRIELFNVAICCSTAVRVSLRRDDTLILHEAFRKRDSSAGIKYNTTVVIERQPCATDTEPNS